MSSSRRTCLTCSSEAPALLKWPAPKQALTMGMGLHIVEALRRCFCGKAITHFRTLLCYVYPSIYMCKSDPVATATCATATLSLHVQQRPSDPVADMHKHFT